MAKKITLSELSKKISNYSDVKKVRDFVNIPELTPDEAPITYFSYYGKGDYEYAYYCPSCNTITIGDKDFVTYGNYTCKKCGKVHLVCEVGGSFNRKLADTTYNDPRETFYVKELNKEERYAIISKFILTYSNKVEEKELVNDGVFEFLKSPYSEYFYCNERDFIFSFDYGIRFYDYSTANQMSNISSNDYSYKIYRFQKEAAFFKDEKYYEFIKILKEFSPETFETIKEYYEERKIKEDPDIMAMVTISNNIIKSRKRDIVKKKPKKVRGEEYVSLELEPLSEKNVSVLGRNLMSIHYESDVMIDKLIHFCPCGHHWKAEQEGGRQVVKEQKVVCPKCKKEYVTENVQTGDENDSYWQSVKYEYVEQLNEIVARYFSVTKYVLYNAEKDEASVKYRFSENKRVFISKNKFSVIEYDRNWKYVKPSKATIGKNLQNRDWGDGACSRCANTREELIDIIGKSDLAKTGLMEAWGLLDDCHVKQLEPMGFISNKSYLAFVISKPFIEQVYKSGLVNVTKDFLSDAVYYDVSYSSESVLDILKINKPVLRMAKKINADFETLREIQALWEEEQTLNLDVYEKIKSFNLKNGYHKLIEIKNKYNIKYLDQLNYLKACYDHQCIHHHEALNIWCDYLRMASTMKYKMKDSKYPDSLKKEHDRAVFAYEVVKDKIMHEKFIEQSKVNQKYEYENKTDEFIVIVPKEPEDIISEGKSLKHCVASYVESVRNGNTVICFIRRKEAPEESFFTSEVLNGQIYQVKGYTNELPKDEKLLKFIDKWAKAKNLTVEHF